jgi:hypothetical protein
MGFLPDKLKDFDDTSLQIVGQNSYWIFQSIKIDYIGYSGV